MRAPVHLRARVVPRLEDAADGARQLVARVLRERAARLLLVDRLEHSDESAQVVGVEIRVLLHAFRLLHVGQALLEAVRVDAVDHLAVHLHEAAVRVEGEAVVAGLLREPLGRNVAEAEVEDRVHHPRHRDRRTGTYGDEQRIARVAEALAGTLLEPGDVLCDLVLEPVGETLTLRHVGAAGVGRDREAGRDRNADLGHLGEPGALAAQQLPAGAGAVVEVVDKGHRDANLPTASAGSARVAARTHLREQPRDADPEPHREEDHVEEDERGSHQRKPQRPAPRWNRCLLLHALAAAALRRSTIRSTRCAVSSIDSSDTSTTGQPSCRWMAAACSSSS